VELTASQTQSLANALSQVAANGGNVEMLMSKFPRLLQGLSGEELANAVNMLASTNWNKQEDIDSTIAALERFGVIISEDFTREIYAAANTVMSLNLDKLESELDNLQELLDMIEIKNSEDSKVYTQDEKEKLVAAGFAEGSFIRTGIDEYIFTGETDTLLSDINNKVGQILGEMQGDLTYAVE
jgi:transcriptional regulator with XRE-family HTH domain